MRVLGNEENIQVKRDSYKLSDPYKLPNQEFWRVSIKNGNVSRYKVLFIELKEANRFRIGRTEHIPLIKLPIINDDTGKTIEEMYFSTRKVLESYVKTFIKDEASNIIEKAKLVEQSQTLTLETMATDDYGSLDEYSDEDLEEQIREFEKNYTEKSVAAKSSAKNILLSIADYYLGQDYIQRNEYVKYRLALEEHSLSTLIFQIEVSKKAIFELSKLIFLGTATSKHYDSLAAMQRIILDVNKCQSSLIKEIIEDFGRVRVRNKEINGETLPDGTHETDGVVINSSNRKAMMKEIKKIIKSANDDDIDDIESIGEAQ
jgi:hypothetical protein